MNSTAGRWIRHVSAMVLAGAVAVFSAAAEPKAADVDETRALAAESDLGNWLMYGRTYAEDHYSPLEQINAGNIKRLGVAWSGEFDSNRGQEATPLVIDGVLYTTTAWSKVYAYDAATGKQLWFYDPKVPGKKAADGCCDVVNRGVAAWRGKLYLGAFDGRLIALDAKTGKPVWEVQTTDTARNYTITGTPRVVKGKVLIGNGGAELQVRGYVSAYDADTGHLDWRFYTTPNPKNAPDGTISDKVLQETAYKTWGNGAWRETGGGGTVWDAIVYDPDFDQILIGTGNGSPWSHQQRSGGKGDNLFLSSIVAVDADTGKYKWHYQETPAEEWDFTATQPIILANLNISGRDRKVLMQAPKNGFFYVIDRETGKLISANNFVPVNWATGIDLKSGRPIENSAARYSKGTSDFVADPSAFGAHNWYPMSFSPKTGLVYIPAQRAPVAYTDNKNFKFDPRHAVRNDSDVSLNPLMSPPNEAARKSYAPMYQSLLIAWDPVKQAEVWRVTYPVAGSAGTLATSGNLVFQGTPDGVLHAYAADSGKELWSYNCQIGIMAGAMSYLVNGEQYIAVLSGLGGSAGLQMPYMDGAHAGTGRVIVFKLNGKGKLPAYSKPTRPVVDTDENFSPEVITRGAVINGTICAFCHGLGTYNNDAIIPDLRRSPMLKSKEAFKSVVLDGALETRGMIGFGDRLTADDAEAARAFFITRARQLKLDESAAATSNKNGKP